MPYLHESTSMPGLTITTHRTVVERGGLLVVSGGDETLIAHTLFFQPPNADSASTTDDFRGGLHIPTLEEIMAITGHEPKPTTSFQICDHRDLEKTTRKIYERLIKLLGGGAILECTLADDPSSHIIQKEHAALVAVAQGISAATGHTIEVIAKEDETSLLTGFYI